jgi:hypothetical protein
MRHLDQGARDDIRTELYRIVTSVPAVKSIAAVCSNAVAYRLPSVNEQQDIYNLAYKVVTERFQYFLQDLNRAGRNERGLIIGDHRGRDDDRRLRAYHQMLVHSSAAFTSRYELIVESVLLQPSNLSIGIQLADMVAGAVWRKYEREDERWFELMASSFRRGPRGEVEGYGVVKVPKRDWA